MTDISNTLVSTKRILVVLDNSARGRAALKAAVQLALDTSSELAGLYVEDEDLVRLASLPFAREVELPSASSRDLQLLTMEDALRKAAQEARRAFSNALNQLNLQWTFRIVRGSVTKASLAAAGDDLLVIGQQGRSPQIMAASHLPNRTTNGHGVVIIFDGSTAAVRAIELASSLAKPAPISVLVLAKDGDQVLQQCMSWLAKSNVRAEIHQASQDGLIEAVRNCSPGVLLINRNAEFISDAQLFRLVNELACPLILC